MTYRTERNLSDKAIADIVRANASVADDPVAHPSHYTQGKIEVIDFIHDKNLNFDRGNAIKYIIRAGLKDPAKEIEDLEKAKQYIDFEIRRIREAQGC